MTDTIVFTVRCEKCHHRIGRGARCQFCGHMPKVEKTPPPRELFAPASKRCAECGGRMRRERGIVLRVLRSIGIGRRRRGRAPAGARVCTRCGARTPLVR